MLVARPVSHEMLHLHSSCENGFFFFPFCLSKLKTNLRCVKFTSFPIIADKWMDSDLAPRRHIRYMCDVRRCQGDPLENQALFFLLCILVTLCHFIATLQKEFQITRQSQKPTPCLSVRSIFLETEHGFTNGELTHLKTRVRQLVNWRLALQVQTI